MQQGIKPNCSISRIKKKHHIQMEFKPHTAATLATESWRNSLVLSSLLLLTMTTICDCQQDGLPSISQISPKSSSNSEADFLAFQSSSRLTVEGTITEATAASIFESDASASHEDNETRQHSNVKRSALPILNENFPRSGPNDVHFPEDSEKDAAAGRYFQYNIKPTGTYDKATEYLVKTERMRVGKTLKPGVSAATTSNSFLLKGDLRPSMSGSPISPTSSTAISTTETATAVPHNPRQNSNPDIQDIITGIVKLLNGNVNVHANTQGMRRPTASRINNRGPPRISEVQPLPTDFDGKNQALGTSIRPPPYPFDRPERPFITGVPIPEQIVPYRPGFVSNRPPWHRNKPRPPITTTIGGRRPLPQYQPMPPAINQEHHMPQQEQQPPPMPIRYGDSNKNQANYEEKPDGNAAKPTDTTYDSEFSNEDINTQYIEVSDQEPEPVGVEENLRSPASTRLPEASEVESGNNLASNKHAPADYTTIIETSSVIHTVMNTQSTYLPMPMESAEDINPDPSTDEVIFMTTSRTPTLESVAVQTDSSSELTPISEHTTSSTLDKTVQTTRNTLIHTTKSVAAIDPTPSSPISIPSSTKVESTDTKQTAAPSQYHPRPGIVLDDPEFKPGGRPRPQQPRHPLPQQPPTHIQPTRHHLPPGYGEIFDVTLSAIQGPGSSGIAQQTINIKPYGSYGTHQHDIIVTASGDDGFVSIDGKRTYINLFGDPTDAPGGVVTTPATAIPQLPHAAKDGVDSSGTNAATQDSVPSLGSSYAVPETEVVQLKPTRAQSPQPLPPPQSPTTNSVPVRPHYRPRTTQPPVRIDTCIVGDDTTCDQAQHERCRTENGISSCHCRPGYSRRSQVSHREPCRKVLAFYIGLRVDRIYEHRIVWDSKFLDRNGEVFGQLSYEAIRAMDSAMSMTPYSDEFMEAKVNNIYRGDPNLGGNGVFINLTMKLDASVETLRPNLRSDVQKHLLGVLHRRNNNIGNSALFVTSPEGAISPLQDLDECQSRDWNDCHASATCTNSWGTFRCACAVGLRDPWADQPQRAGRECQACPDSYCNNRGTCSYNDDTNQNCVCEGSFYGSQCEIDGEVLGVAIGASVAAVVIIVLTLVCLIMWSRRWQREQKNAMGSPVFGYMNTSPLKSAGLAQPGYQVTLEDRMRWAQIADVMAQTNHYGAEPIGPTRPSSAMFAYPNLQMMGMNTMGGLSMQGTMQMHQTGNLAPPVPLPRYERLGLGSGRPNGMRALENSSSSEEEDRTDLLGRNFQVPRPKSRSNGSIANQSGIYYDVDYEPSGNGLGNSNLDHLYGSQNQSSSHSHSGNSHIPGPQGIPMSTYTSGRAPSSYYMK